MKRRIIIEVDDEVFPVGTEEPDRRSSAERLLGHLVGRIQLGYQLQRYVVSRDLEKYGVRVIKNEEI